MGLTTALPRCHTGTYYRAAFTEDLLTLPHRVLLRQAVPRQGSVMRACARALSAHNLMDPRHWLAIVRDVKSGDTYLSKGFLKDK